ncbi:Uncharacterized conserved protein YtfP, gamma-glutamylcyclotransferase (GGCT)/AIG2-like family [Caloramator quimbayensis]|uniref:Uncharacterized conserved protein YtfP, gamma-glutamylcyclotransferase (GGCT)/AIG2-like family n=1 Tax=Caloramator quimbayensis TaxID=1147123 RepID=A0A1T4XY79_9CLOT|nr:gamma-glutamylcyclotransferase family protein [Caloramator quimbayensis]SKA93961.1 Uncharacterized conserved protein YtfP, gamma-glutamylcyclotransferase (GGCT)/AIG2-like family [Caloramator quimbayensis]
MENYLFVYGSLMKDFFNYKYIKNKVLERKYARTKGKLFHQVDKGYPAMIDGEDYIYGELLKFNDWDNVIKSLDRLENYYGEENPQNEYNRVIVDVEILEEGCVVKAFVYKVNLKDEDKFIEKNIYIKSGNWKEFMEKKVLSNW